MLGYISSILLFWNFARFYVHVSVQYRMLILVWNVQLFVVKLRLQWQTPSLLMLMVLWGLYMVHYHVSPLDLLFRLKSCLLSNCLVFKMNLMCHILCSVHLILIEKKPESFEIFFGLVYGHFQRNRHTYCSGLIWPWQIRLLKLRNHEMRRWHTNQSFSLVRLFSS